MEASEDYIPTYFKNGFTCRACLDSSSSPSIPMNLKTIDKDKTNAEIFEYVTSLKVPNDYICDNCLVGLYFCFKFKTKCLKSDAELEQRFLSNFGIKPLNSTADENSNHPPQITVKVERSDSSEVDYNSNKNNFKGISTRKSAEKNATTTTEKPSTVNKQQSVDSKAPIKALHMNFKCKYCARLFLKPKWLQNHLRRDHSKKVLILPKRNFRNNSKEPPNKQPPAPPTTTSNPTTENNNNNNKTRFGKINCFNCHQKFTNLKFYKKHLQSQTCFISLKMNPISLNAPITDKKKVGKGLVKQEPSEETSSTFTKLQCSDCWKSFNQWKGLEYHIRNKVCSRGKMSFKCKNCSKKFLQSGGLQYHLKNNVCSKRSSTDGDEN